MFSRLQHIMERLRDLLSLPALVRAWSQRVLRDSHAEARKIQTAFKDQTRRLAARSSEQHARLEGEIRAVRAEVHDRLLQYHLQLGRLTSLLEGRSAEPPVYAPPIPFEVEPPATPVSAAPATGEWLELTRCPGCHTAARTLVCKWNKSILLDKEPEDDSTISNYALCHGCGIVYATRRPVGERHRALMDDFPDTIGRDPAAAAANPMLNPYPLSEDDRARYLRMIAGGVFVSDHERREHLSQVYRDRLENASHVELLGSLLDVTGARVLEIRSRAGSIAHGLRRHYGARVAVMPIFESQRLIVEELYGIECSDLIDYDQFTIPFDGHSI